MQANVNHARLEQSSQVSQHNNLIDEMYHLVESWCKTYEDYLVHRDNLTYFRETMGQHFAKCYENAFWQGLYNANKIILLASALEETLIREIRHSALLMAWSEKDYLPWLEEFCVETIQPYPGRALLPKKVCLNLLNQIIGQAHSYEHAEALFVYYRCGNKTHKPKRLAKRLNYWGNRWYYPDYFLPSPNTPNGQPYGERLGYLWDKKIK